MLATSTLFRAEEGIRKQLTMPRWAAFALSDTPTLSKGLAANEAVLAANREYSDELTEIEEPILRELSRAYGGDFWEALENKISNRTNEARGELAEKCQYEDPYEREENVDVYLLESLTHALPQRYVGDLVADSVEWHYASPWSSRAERIQDFQDLLAWNRGETVAEPSEWVQSVMDRSEEWSDLYDALAPGQEWWESPDLTLDDLRARADDIPTTREPRVSALETALSNDSKGYTRDEVVDLARDVYGCVLQTARAYADDVDLAAAESETGHRIDVTSLIDDIVAESEESHPKEKFRKVMGQLSHHEIAGFRSDPTSYDGYYESDEEALQAIEDIAKKLGTVKRIPLTRQNANEMQNRLQAWADEIQGV